MDLFKNLRSFVKGCGMGICIPLLVYEREKSASGLAEGGLQQPPNAKWSILDHLIEAVI